MRRSTSRLSVVLLLSALAGLTGCSSGPAEPTAIACPSWAGYDTPADAVSAASAVVLGRIQVQSGTTELYGGTANVWSVSVQEWVKGDGPDQIEVISVPDQCGSGDERYMGGDPFEAAAADDLSVFFLSDENGGYRGLSPLAGVTEAVDGTVPEAWPAAS